MSSSLLNSARLARNTDFVDLIRAAVVEKAVGLTGGTDTGSKLARAAMRDVDSILPPFVRAAADDAVISATSWTQNETDIRRVVEARWAIIAGAMPNLGV